MPRCECPDDAIGMPESLYSEEELPGRVHKANKCPCTAGLRKYLRDGKEIWLCSCCNMPGDNVIE
jgi:ribosomal protein L37AE/L43A